MPDQRRPPSSRDKAEAMFKAVTTKPVAPLPEKQAAIPGVREQVTLRIDQAVLDHFRDGGPGWQDRINDALKKIAGV
jgi:uncharacterized protein (DUF4415 family)